MKKELTKNASWNNITDRGNFMVIRKIMALLLLLPFVLYCPNEEETGNQTQFEKEPDNKTDEERQDPAHCSDKGEDGTDTKKKDSLKINKLIEQCKDEGILKNTKLRKVVKKNAHRDLEKKLK